MILVALVIISLLTIFDAPLRFTFITSLFKKREVLEDEEGESKLIISNPEQMSGMDAKSIKETLAPAPPLSDMKREVPQPEKKDEFGISPLSFNGKEFTPPPLSLLQEDRGKPGVGDIKANSNIIKRTLANFGINVEMDEISIGPSITRYALKPAEGVKLSRIVGLQNDLSLALAAHPIRIEAPIPGKSLVGI
jgi:S-DNA-T family DNA segregation ATPase FtsK/SpoIIIE